MSLNSRILGTFLGLLMASVALMAALAYRLSSDALEQAVSAKLHRALSDVLTRTESHLERARTTLEAWASRSDVPENLLIGDLDGTLSRALKDLVTPGLFLDGFECTNRAGLVVASSRVDLIKRNASADEWFRLTTGGSAFVGDIVTDPRSGFPAIRMAMLIIGEVEGPAAGPKVKGVIGVVTGLVDWRPVLQAFARGENVEHLAGFPSTRFFLADIQGTILGASPEMGGTKDLLAIVPGVGDVLGVRSASVVTRVDVGGVSSLVALSPVPATALKIGRTALVGVAVVPIREALAGSRDLLKTIVFIGLLLGLVLGPFGAANLRRLVAPIKAFASFAETVGQGRLTADDLDVAGSSDLEVLRRALNLMKANLTRYRQEVEGNQAALTKANEGLARRAHELAQSSKYKSEFLANMSHEIRTPLNSLLIMSKMLASSQTESLSPQQLRFIEIISRSGHDLLVLINDILDLAKVESGNMRLEVTDVPLASFARRVIEQFEPLALQKGIELKTVVEPGLPAHVQMDGTRVGQVLRNLIGNAMKFTSVGSVVLRVSSGSSSTAASDALNIRFEVRDTGIGIPQDKLALIFESFQQADGSTTRRYGGTGLGLSISRELALLMGGHISVASQTDNGSTFALEFPTHGSTLTGPGSTFLDEAGFSAAAASSTPSRLLPSSPPEVRATSESSTVQTPSSAPSTDSGSRALNLLVIEDDETMADVMKGHAGARGFRVHTATNGHDGLVFARSLRPTAIILDLDLPLIDGMGVLRSLKRDPEVRHIPVHVVTALDLAVPSLDEGAVEVVAKPIEMTQFEAILEHIGTRAGSTSRSLLVVEDDPDQISAMRLALESRQVDITFCTTGAAALEWLETNRTDCIVLDLGLPDMTGQQVLERILGRPDHQSVPVIIHTAAAADDLELQRLRGRVRRVVQKGRGSMDALIDGVSLFLHQVEASLSSVARDSLGRVRRSENALRGRRMLIVDDDSRNIEALQAILEAEGAVVVPAHGGPEALAAMEAHSDWAAVVTDIMMPGMDGYELMRRIRHQPAWRALPIIALTARAMVGDEELCLGAGASDYMSKPVDPPTLVDLLAAWMRAA